MAHHKRKKRLSSRGHCKMCKFWKQNGVRTESKDGERHSDHVRRKAAEQDATDA